VRFFNLVNSNNQLNHKAIAPWCLAIMCLLVVFIPSLFVIASILVFALFIYYLLNGYGVLSLLKDKDNKWN
jgi:hypothetical protein